MKEIYLAAYKANHPTYEIVYQDINGNRDIPGNMLDINLKEYDYIIATPPCNYYSKARGSNPPSDYAFRTKHLLPEIIKKLMNFNKPFIVENVRNFPKFDQIGLFNLHLYVYFIGRHTYWTNIMFNPSNIKQQYDFTQGGNIRIPGINTQGGKNVHRVIEYWLKVIHS